MHNFLSLPAAVELIHSDVWPGFVQLVDWFLAQVQQHIHLSQNAASWLNRVIVFSEILS